jgi:hypothetical protein
MGRQAKKRARAAPEKMFKALAKGRLIGCEGEGPVRLVEEFETPEDAAKYVREKEGVRATLAEHAAARADRKRASRPWAR